MEAGSSSNSIKGPEELESSPPSMYAATLATFLMFTNPDGEINIDAVTKKLLADGHQLPRDVIDNARMMLVTDYRTPACKKLVKCSGLPFQAFVDAFKKATATGIHFDVANAEEDVGRKRPISDVIEDVPAPARRRSGRLPVATLEEENYNPMLVAVMHTLFPNVTPVDRAMAGDTLLVMEHPSNIPTDAIVVRMNNIKVGRFVNVEDGIFYVTLVVPDVRVCDNQTFLRAMESKTVHARAVKMTKKDILAFMP